MTDLRIADAPELTAAEVNDTLKVPTGGYGNYSITMITIRDWLLNYKMFATQSYVDTKVSVVTTTLNNHTSRIDNPHQVTKTQVGLGNVDNTSDINKPISSATQTALTNLNTSLTSAISVKANAADVYTKSEVYTKLESDGKYHQKLSIDGILAPTAVFDDVKNIDGVNGSPDSIINQPIQNLANRTEFLKTHNNLSGRNSANSHPSEAISYGNITQKKYNDGVESISELLSISNPFNGMKVYVKSYHAGLEKGGGVFIYDATKSSINDGGLIINGWVRVKDSPYIHPEWFGAKGDGVTDDYTALTKCFTSITPLSATIYDGNFQQQASVSTTFMLDSVVYRHTQPLRLPAMADVISKGAITYFLEPQIVTRNNRPCFYYDGADLEVAAIYLPLYINNGDGTWSLNNDSTYIANAGDANERSMSVSTKLRFNVITKQNTKIGVNLFGHESGEAELGVGTMGTWASDQTAAAAMQSQDYNYDDLSPRCGIYVSRAWNGKLTRPRVIAHKTGVYLGRHAAGYVVDQPYINRQLDKHTDAMGLQSEFLPEGIPPSKNVTCGIVMSEFNGTLNDPITEHWGVPYMISKTGVTINKPHVEGSNLIMNHNFIIYQCAVTVNNWSGIRSMYERNGTSIVYSNGMSLAFGNFFEMKGAGYYADNSGFIIVDGSGFDANYNGYFLSIENIPHDKLGGIAWFTDSRYIKEVKFASAKKYTIYIDQTKTGVKKGFGVGAATALQGLSYLDEAIRLLGGNWNGNIELLSNITLTSDTGISSNVDPIVNLNGKTIHSNGGSFLLNGNISILFLGSGTLKATGVNMFKNTEYAKRKTQIQTLDGVLFDTTSYIYQLEVSPFVDFTLNINNSNLTSAFGKYANIGNALGSVDIFVKSITRNTAYDSSPADNATNSIVRSKFLN